MENNTDKLQHDFDSAFLALIMDEYAEELGESILKEYQESEEYSNENVTQTKSLDALCLQTIKDSKEPPSNRHGIKFALRKFGIAAAVIAVIFATLIVVQAAGVNVFGALAQWTDSVFRFGNGTSTIINETESSNSELNALLQSLERMNIPTQLAPTRIPDGYAFVDIAENRNEKMHGIVSIFMNSRQDCLTIEVSEYYDDVIAEDRFIEKDIGEMEQYISKDKTFYLVTNTGKWSAVWSDGRYYLFLGGFPTKEELCTVIDSI